MYLLEALNALGELWGGWRGIGKGKNHITDLQY